MSNRQSRLAAAACAAFLLATLTAGCGEKPAGGQTAPKADAPKASAPAKVETTMAQVEADRAAAKAAGEKMAAEAIKAGPVKQVQLEFERKTFTTPPKKSKVYTFTMDVPKGWKMTDQTSPQTDTTTIHFLNPAKDAASDASLWFVMNAGLELDATLVKNMLENPDPDSTKSEDKVFEFDGFRARQRVCSSLYGNKSPKRVVKYHCYKLTCGISIVVTGPATLVDTHREALDRMVKSIKIEG